MKLLSIVYCCMFVAVQAASIKHKEIPVQVVQDGSLQTENIRPQSENIAEANNNIKEGTELEDGNKFNPIKWAQEQAPRIASLAVRFIKDRYFKDNTKAQLPEEFWKKLQENMKEFLVNERQEIHLMETNDNQIQLNENQAFNIFKNMLKQTVHQQRPEVAGQLVNLSQGGIGLIKKVSNILTPVDPNWSNSKIVDKVAMYAALIGWDSLLSNKSQ